MAEEARDATVAAVAATAESLAASLEQMKFLADSRETLRRLQAGIQTTH